MHPNGMVQRLINKVLEIALPYALKQVRVDRTASGTIVDADGRIRSATRPGYSGNFSQLALFAAMCTQLCPQI